MQPVDDTLAQVLYSEGKKTLGAFELFEKLGVKVTLLVSNYQNSTDN